MGCTHFFCSIAACIVLDGGALPVLHDVLNSQNDPHMVDSYALLQASQHADYAVGKSSCQWDTLRGPNALRRSETQRTGMAPEHGQSSLIGTHGEWPVNTPALRGCLSLPFDCCLALSPTPPFLLPSYVLPSLLPAAQGSDLPTRLLRVHWPNSEGQLPKYATECQWEHHQHEHRGWIAACSRRSALRAFPISCVAVQNLIRVLVQFHAMHR